ncbi:MAG: PAS domain S-box protein, partial [Pseudomonadota bacterium]|nr:PAS domain S-box protein [Pseudomonadota bacterium]
MSDSATPDLAQDDRRFRAALMASASGIASVDLQGRWLEVNPAFERMFGFKAAEIAGRDVSALTHPDDADLTLGHLRMFGEHPQDADPPVSDHKSRYLHQDGRIVWTQASVGVMRDDAGQPLSLIVQLRDITAQHDASETLEQQARTRGADLETATRQLDVFASGIAHDLRAPLRAIESYGKLLDKHAGARLQAEEQDYLQRILRASGRMACLVDGLSELSRVTTAQLAPAPVDLTLLAEWALAELQED